MFIFIALFFFTIYSSNKFKLKINQNPLITKKNCKKKNEKVKSSC